MAALRRHFSRFFTDMVAGIHGISMGDKRWFDPDFRRTGCGSAARFISALHSRNHRVSSSKSPNRRSYARTGRRSGHPLSQSHPAGGRLALDASLGAGVLKTKGRRNYPFGRGGGDVPLAGAIGIGVQVGGFGFDSDVIPKLGLLMAAPGTPALTLAIFIIFGAGLRLGIAPFLLGHPGYRSEDNPISALLILSGWTLWWTVQPLVQEFPLLEVISQNGLALTALFAGLLALQPGQLPRLWLVVLICTARSPASIAVACAMMTVSLPGRRKYLHFAVAGALIFFYPPQTLDWVAAAGLALCALGFLKTPEPERSGSPLLFPETRKKIIDALPKLEQFCRVLVGIYLLSLVLRVLGEGG